VDIVLKIFGEQSQQLFFAELGTGSGAISIALALAYPLCEGIATDIDQNALEIAIENYINSSKQSNLKFYCGHWWNPLESFRGKLDLAISNPPYITKETYEKLPKIVKNFEPKIALLGGEDGLKHIREIIQKAPLFLKEKGWLILENHYDQGEKVKQLLLKKKFTSIENVKDLSGIGRFTIGRYK
jgi:release factor glutamine methyltransferase